MAKSTNPNSVGSLYQTVINDVINNIREAFLDDGVDEQVLQELKQTWESKVVQSKAVQPPTDVVRRGQSSSMPVYTVYPRGAEQLTRVVYQRTPGLGSQGLQMTAAGQQAALALPNSIVYQQRLSDTVSQPTQVYSSHQPQLSQSVTRPAVVLSSQNPANAKEVGKQSQQPSVIIQVDGAIDDELSCKETASVKKLQSNTCKCSVAKAKTCQHSVSGAKVCRFVCPAQLDGNLDSSSSDDDDDDDDAGEDDDDDEDDDEDEKEASKTVDEDPLCSDDDGSDEDPVELFDTDNVVVCQYDKIHRTKSRWKFNLKVGIMNLNGKDHVFQKANGEAEW